MYKDKRGHWVCSTCKKHMSSGDYGYYCDNTECKKYDKDYEVTARP